jgi:hypothetical protein
LLAGNECTEQALAALRAEVGDTVAGALAFADASPLADPGEVLADG